jgi:O-antigen ligase
MSESQRALIAVLLLSAPLLWWLLPGYLPAAMPAEDARRRRRLWLGLTCFGFLLTTFWLYSAALLGWSAAAGRRDANRLAVFAFLLFVLPSFPVPVPGFLGLNYLLDINHQRILSLGLLLPIWWARRSEPSASPWCDRLVLMFMALQFGLQLMTDTLTNSLRFATYNALDLYLPYFAASRALRALSDYRDFMAAFVFSALLMAPIAGFESVKHWLLYSGIPGHMDQTWAMGGYLGRGESLRALAAAGHALVLGYVMVVALGLFAFVAPSIPTRARRASWCLLGIGLLAPLSRGPWIGACALILLWVASAERPGRAMTRLFMLLVPLGGLLFLTPYGDKLIDLLPFVGTVDEFNVTYRQRLFTAATAVIAHNPWLGSFEFLSAPEMQEMIQGEGIIDIVNTYIGLALSYGLIGLGLFLAIFANAGWRTWQMTRHADIAELKQLGRFLLATLAAVLITIATVSSIVNIAVIYWMLAGLCAATPRLLAATREAPALRQQPGGAWVGAASAS